MLGLKRGMVELLPHQTEWDENARLTIEELKEILQNIVIDIQHIGSTAVKSIYSKPIIDIAVGVENLDDIIPYTEVLRQNNYIYRGEDVSGQLLFVKGDFEKDTRTHHIHIVKWNGVSWNNYINFRDYLNTFSDKAVMYDKCKKELAKQFPCDRVSYTSGKQKLIDLLLSEAEIWKSKFN